MCAKANPPVRRVSTRRQFKSTGLLKDDVVETCSQSFNWSKDWSTRDWNGLTELFSNE
ncbi:Uncharacterised protein [Burkholderia pseudomallei]|nr:Uncharacterised protein [Burkholderia pseudomallei]VBC15579.1 Uncharacterised protein [Burkholderia pseudomallei]VBS98888.1 Uncharacterised protein [Burkholderia pseudomallei]